MGRVRALLGLGPSKTEQAIARLESRNRNLTTRLLEEVARNHAPTRSGVNLSFGEYLYEQNTDLRGTKRWESYDKMLTDPAVDEALNQFIAPLVNADWSIEAASDKPKDQEVRDFVAANLLRETNDRFGREHWIRTPWRAQRLPEILTCLWAGYSMFARVTRRVGTKLVYDRLQWLEPSSVDPMGWELDNEDNILRVNRTYQSNDRFVYRDPIEAAQLVLYVHAPKGARYEGRPLTRPMFGAWARKEHMQRMAILWAQKVGAPAVLGQYRDGMSEDEIDRFVEFVKSCRGEDPDKAFGAFAMGSDGTASQVAYVSDGADEVNRLGGVIGVENAEIARAGGTKSRLLGETESGSRALASTQALIEMGRVEALAPQLCEQIAHGISNLVGEIEWLVRANYGDRIDVPAIVVSKINPFQQQQTFDRQIALWEKGVVPHVPEVRRQMAESAAFSLPDDAYEVEELPVAPQPPQPVPMRRDDADEPPSDSERLAMQEDFRSRIAPLLVPVEEGAPPGAGFRRQTRLERALVNLAGVSDAFRVGERDITTDLRRIGSDMRAELMQRLRAGKITPRTLDTQRRSKYRGQRRAEASLRVTFDRVGATGVEHVEAEVRRAEMGSHAAA